MWFNKLNIQLRGVSSTYVVMETILEFSIDTSCDLTRKTVTKFFKEIYSRRRIYLLTSFLNSRDTYPWYIHVVCNAKSP